MDGCIPVIGYVRTYNGKPIKFLFTFIKICFFLFIKSTSSTHFHRISYTLTLFLSPPTLDSSISLSLQASHISVMSIISFHSYFFPAHSCHSFFHEMHLRWFFFLSLLRPLESLKRHDDISSRWLL